MPNRRFDWHEHIKDIEGEYRAARLAVDQWLAQLGAFPDLLDRTDGSRAYLREADKNLEGTYLVLLFAAFEAALRSFDRAKHNNPSRILEASILINSTAGRRGQGISTNVREGAHAVRKARNYWAHENDDDKPPEMSLAEARARLQTFLSWLPEEWS